MIRRPPRSTLSSSSAASDVYKRQVLKKSLPVVDAASSAEVTAALTTSTIFSSMSSTSRTEVVDSCNVFGDALLVARHLIAAAPVSCMVASSNVASVARWTLRQIATISSDATRSSLGLLTSEHVPGDDAQSKEAKRRLKHAVTRLGKLDKQLSLGDEDQKWKIRGRVVRVRTVAFRLSLIHISEPTRLLSISYAVFCLKKKKTKSAFLILYRYTTLNIYTVHYINPSIYFRSS
eukprot:TRINITY_DN9850_c0_g1_i3.p1 TRINITY_DN9850_c0_g1~~TRINITY_DN9850_c0_g1_i3.p1  ORF type:complete len:234 (+),score=24.61 TRINITY_DN9850_c0_g1_i3:132-833(+)